MKQIVRLTECEIEFAAYVGVKRSLTSVGKEQRSDNGDPNFGWHHDIEAACAEMAFAKYSGLYWNAGVNTFKEPDVGGYQVRHTRHVNGKLILRPNDKDDEKYVLVRGVAPEYEIVGWAYGRYVKLQINLSTPNGRPSCWMTDVLEPPEELKEAAYG